jgi:A/G-specific adenine glycosylase
VAAVGPYFQKFIARWPTVERLARADPDDVLAAWAGLGYYARARNLHKCARAVAKLGKFPETVEELLELPGIGPYTAAAISSIAFDKPAVAVDGNVERVVSRFFAVEEPLPLSKNILRENAAKLAKGVSRPGDFTQAFMELGATVCTPRAPKCGACPWRASCAAFKKGNAAELPRKLAKKAKPVRYGRVFWITRADGKFRIEKREGQGLYEGMYQLPTTDWVDKKSFPALKSPGRMEPSGLTVRHSFTHFDLVLEIWRGHAGDRGGVWISREELSEYALPSLMKKAVRLCAGG